MASGHRDWKPRAARLSGRRDCPEGSRRTRRGLNGGALNAAATRRGGGAGEIRTRERGTPVTAFPVRTPSAPSFWCCGPTQLQFDLNLTSAPAQLLFNRTLFLEVPSPTARKCRDLLISYRAFVSAFIWMRSDDRDTWTKSSPWLTTPSSRMG